MNWKAVVNTFLIASVVLFLVIACGIGYKYTIENIKSNREQGVDANNFFKVAYIRFGDGTMKKVNVKSWRDFPTALNVQITDDRGITYLTSYSNVVLMSDDQDDWLSR